jgi:hypothetical protein
MNLTWLWLLAFPAIGVLIFLIKRLKTKAVTQEPPTVPDLSAQLSMLEERTKQLQGLEEKIEKVRDKQDSESKELREKLYTEYSTRLQDSVELLKGTYEKMSATTASAFRDVANRTAEAYKQTATSVNATTASLFKEITSRNLEVYKQTATQLNNLTVKLEAAFKVLEEKEHTQMRSEIEALRCKISDLERDPLKVQLEELGEARAAQAVHEQSVRKITAIFWPANGELKFGERIGQYQPDVCITNHKLKIVADEVTTEDATSIREKVKKVAEYMRGLNANIGYVIVPNAGIDPEGLREIRRTVSERGLYVVRITEYAVHLQVWRDVAITGVIDFGSLVEKGHNFLHVVEPIFEEYLAVVQSLEHRDERDFTYRQNRYKELKFFPKKMLDALERTSKISG